MTDQSIVRQTFADQVDKELERALRPLSFDDFTGQDKVLENLKIFVAAATRRGEALDHVLLHGPPGLGKTSAMEDYKIDILLDSGPNARSVQISLNPFTLVGATTRAGLLTSPLRARFSINCRLEYYDADLLTTIIQRSAGMLGSPIHVEAAAEIARRSRGTPRIANNLLRRTRDFAQVLGNGTIDVQIARRALHALEVDSNGLDEMDNRILMTIIGKFKGGPVGLSTIATACGEEAETIEEVYEPYLIQEGYIKRTARGREATEKAYQHLDVPMPAELLAV
mgnify:CR=1 FL=1